MFLQAKTEEWIGSTKDSAQSAKESAHETKEEAAGILQQVIIPKLSGFGTT